MGEREMLYREFTRHAKTPVKLPERPIFLDLLEAARTGRDLDKIYDSVREKIGKLEIPELVVTQANNNALRHSVERLSRLHVPYQLVERSLFCSLNSYFDGFLRDVLLTALAANQGSLRGLAADTNISYSELLASGKINDVPSFVAERVVDGLSRETYAKQFERLRKALGWDVAPEGQLKLDFEECTERRHLFTHCDGKVSMSYCRKLRELGVKDSEIPPVGQQMDIGEIYVRRAINVFFVIGMKIAQVILRKLFTETGDRKANDLLLINQQLASLKISRWWRVVELGNMMDTEKELRESILSDQMRRIMAVNQAQALKWDGKDSECNRLLEQYDWSSVGNEFKLAEAVLRDDWKRAAGFMRRLGVCTEVTKSDYLDWPLFRQFRKSKEFADVFKEVFGESFEKAAGLAVNVELKHKSSVPSDGSLLPQEPKPPEQGGN